MPGRLAASLRNALTPAPGSLGARLTGTQRADNGGAPLPRLAGLVVSNGAFWSGFGDPVNTCFPLAETSVAVVDGGGRHVTVTRAAMLGPLALAAKRRDPVTLVFTRSDGRSFTIRTNDHDAALVWAAQFTAWQSAQRESRMAGV